MTDASGQPHGCLAAAAATVVFDATARTSDRRYGAGCGPSSQPGWGAWVARRPTGTGRQPARVLPSTSTSPLTKAGLWGGGAACGIGGAAAARGDEAAHGGWPSSWCSTPWCRSWAGDLTEQTGSTQVHQIIEAFEQVGRELELERSLRFQEAVLSGGEGTRAGGGQVPVQQQDDEEEEEEKEEEEKVAQNFLLYLLPASRGRGGSEHARVRIHGGGDH